MIRIKVYEDLPNALMITHYTATKPAEIGYVGYIPYGKKSSSRPASAQVG